MTYHLLRRLLVRRRVIAEAITRAKFDLIQKSAARELDVDVPTPCALGRLGARVFELFTSCHLLLTSSSFCTADKPNLTTRTRLQEHLDIRTSATLAATILANHPLPYLARSKQQHLSAPSSPDRPFAIAVT